MSRTVLSIAYPFAPMTVDPVGGGEQIVAHLDRALVEAGWRSIVIAAEGCCWIEGPLHDASD